MRPLLIAILLITVTTTAGYANDAEDIFLRVQQRVESIEDLSMEIRVRSRLPGLTMPDRTGTLYFKRPDKLHLEGEGFMMIPREALLLDFSAMKDSLTEAKVLMPDSLAGTSRLLMEFRRIEDNRITVSRALVDTLLWIVERLDIDEGSRFKSRIKFDYVEIGGVRLPKYVRADIESSRLNRQVRNPRSRRMTADPEDGGGYIEMEFSRHKVNSGLDDAIFPEEETGENE